MSGSFAPPIVYPWWDGTNWQFRQSTRPTTRPDGSAIAVGDRWFDVTDRLWWLWDGAYWLGEQRIVTGAQITSITTTNTQSALLTPPANYNLFLLDFRVSGIFITPQNANDYWSVTLQRTELGVANQTNLLTMTISNLNISSSFQWQRFSSVLNLHQDVSALSIASLRIFFTRFASGGSLSNIDCRLAYQLTKP